MYNFFNIFLNCTKFKNNIFYIINVYNTFIIIILSNDKFFFKK